MGDGRTREGSWGSDVEVYRQRIALAASVEDSSGERRILPTIRGMDELAEVFPNCPHCLHRLELAGEPAELYWICDCGVAPAT